MGILREVDLFLLGLINKDLAFGLLDDFMLFITDRWTWIYFSIAFLCFALWLRSIKMLHIFFAALIGIALTDPFCFLILKQFYARLRPCYQLIDIRLVTESCGGYFGFPSNHAANGMAVAVAVFAFSRTAKGLYGFLVAFLVGVSRVYVGVHFPLDVIFGFGVGITIGVIAVWIYSGFIQKRLEVFLNRTGLWEKTSTRALP